MSHASSNKIRGLLVAGRRMPGIRVFKGRGSRLRPNKESMKSDDSVGSTLSTSDQFDIVIVKKVRSPAGSWGSRDDSSTVSSITTDERRVYRNYYSFQTFNTNRTRMGEGGDASEDSSWWCCCAQSTSTGETENSGVDADGNKEVTVAKKTTDNSSEWVCFGSSSRKATSAVPKPLVKKVKKSNVDRDNSLFDTLSEDDDDQAAETRKKQWRDSIRRALPWKRKQMTRKEMVYMQDAF